MNVEEQICEFTEQHHRETIELLKTLAAIPAPSHHEEKRAEFVRHWLISQGAEKVHIDEAGNVLYLFGGQGNTKQGTDTGENSRQAITVVAAHMDVVFPDREPLPVRQEEGKLFAPGVGDNTANLVNLLMTIKFLLSDPQKQWNSEKAILFAANVGEEGLGNLKGSREIMKHYGKRIARWVSFDLYYHKICSRAVGSQRYRITVKTRGGHSYSDFGERNAIAELAELVGELYRQKTPWETKTTYNVGQISGGTSINTIAQKASVTYEFRSESASCLKRMEQSMEQILEQHRSKGVETEVEILGIRPGMGPVDEQKQERLVQACRSVVETYYSGTICMEAASTDSNIPLSEGIPAITVGTVLGGLLHTRQEWIFTDSMKTGQKIAIGVVLECLNE